MTFSGNYHYRIYNPSSDESVAFEISVFSNSQPDSSAFNLITFSVMLISFLVSEGKSEMDKWKQLLLKTHCNLFQIGGGARGGTFGASCLSATSTREKNSSCRRSTQCRTVW